MVHFAKLLRIRFKKKKTNKKKKKNKIVSHGTSESVDYGVVKMFRFGSTSAALYVAWIFQSNFVLQMATVISANARYQVSIYMYTYT